MCLPHAFNISAPKVQENSRKDIHMNITQCELICQPLRFQRKSSWHPRGCVLMCWAIVLMLEIENDSCNLLFAIKKD